MVPLPVALMLTPKSPPPQPERTYSKAGAVRGPRCAQSRLAQAGVAWNHRSDRPGRARPNLRQACRRSGKAPGVA